MHTKGHIRDYFEVLVDERFFGSEELDLEDVAGVSDVMRSARSSPCSGSWGCCGTARP